MTEARRNGRGSKLPLRAARTTPSSGSHCGPLLVACVDAAICKVQGGGWQAIQSELRSRPFTLVHWDFHPTNVLLPPPSSATRSSRIGRLWGWAEARRSSQLMISHTRPNVRAAVERESVAKYYAQLRAYHPQIAMTLGQCWEKYVVGGLARWLFFLA